MTIKRSGRKPARNKAKEAAEDKATAPTAPLLILRAKAKLTVSIKRRLGNGDEVFIAPGLEMDCEVDALEETQVIVANQVHAWMDALLEAYPDAELSDDDEEESDDEEEGDDEEGDDEEDDEEEDEDDLTEADIKKMNTKALLALIDDNELDVEPDDMKLPALRKAVIVAWFSDDDEEESDDEEEGDDEEDDEEEDEDDLTEEELNGMKLADLQNICDEWEIGEPKIAKGAKLTAKKEAYVAHIMDSADDE